MRYLGNSSAKNNLHIKLKPQVYGMSWCALLFPRTPIRKLRGFKGFYFIKVEDKQGLNLDIIVTRGSDCPCQAG